MPDVGDIETATLTVSPFSGTTTGVLTVYAPDGTTTTPTVSGNGTGTLTAVVTYAQAGWYLLRWVVTGTGAGTGYQQVFVPVAPTVPIVPVYATVDQLKLALASNTAALSTREELLQQALLGASRGIDAYCGRRFYLDTQASARTFNPRGRVRRVADGDLLLVADIGDTAGLIVETGSATSSWSAVSAYETSPDDALYDGRPVTGILAGFGMWTPRARITAPWGWPSVPDIVVQATLIQAARLYRRKDSPEGVAGSAEWGLVRVPNIDPDVKALIASLVLPGIG